MGRLECYNRITKREVTREQGEQSLIQWQKEWDKTTKGATTKSFFLNIKNRLQLRINRVPNFTATVTGQGNLKAYLHNLYRV